MTQQPVSIQQEADGSLFKLIGEWTNCPHGDDGQFTLWLDNQPAFKPRVWWEPQVGRGHVTIGTHLHTVIGDQVDCQAFSVDLLEWLVGHYQRTTEHG
jgi:hypothetical protein